MVLDINIDKLTKLIESFYKLTKIKIAIYDNKFNELFAYPKNDSKFCEMVNRFPEAKFNCRESVKNLCAECRKTNQLVTLTCHAGLTEVAAPLFENDVIIGYIMFGQITNTKDKQKFIEHARFLCRNYPFDKKEFEGKILTVPYKNNENITAVSEIINAFTAYIYLDHIVTAKKEDAITLLIKYVENNLSSDLSTQKLCEKFYISKTMLYEITKSAMPQGIAKYIRSKRLDAAKNFIVKTNKSIEEISGLVGFVDSNYFRRVFKKETGMSASAYRKKFQISANHRESST